MRTLNAYVDQSLIGSLSEGDGLWSFTYDGQWAAHASSFDLSPALPRGQLTHQDGGTLRPVQWYFDNLLPEETLRLAVVQEGGIKDAQDAFALLEYLGAESAGSLTLLPPGVQPPDTRELRKLTDQDLSERISNLPKATLAKSAPKRMSVAGAQHKLLVVLLGEEAFEPVGATPSTYILKPDHPQSQTYPASAFNEYITMRLARAAKLLVPRILLRHVPQPVYYIERFDRRVTSAKRVRGAIDKQDVPSVKRLHVVDACQLLNKDRLFKHAGATLEALSDIISKCTNKLATRQALFRWLTFNVLVGNDDSHLKNLSFFIDHEGVRLAPHYDLLSTGAYHTQALAEDHGHWAAVPMTFELPGAKHFADVTYEGLAQAGLQLGIPRPVVDKIIDDVTSRVDKEFAAIEQEHDERTKNCPAELAPYYAIEARLLRVIKHITLKDMLGRLK